MNSRHFNGIPGVPKSPTEHFKCLTLSRLQGEWSPSLGLGEMGSIWLALLAFVYWKLTLTTPWWCWESCCKCKRGCIGEFRGISQNVTLAVEFFKSKQFREYKTCWSIDQTSGSKSMKPAMQSLACIHPKPSKNTERGSLCNPSFSWSSSTLKCCSSNKPSKRPQVSTKRISTGLKRIGLEQQKKRVPVFSWMEDGRRCGWNKFTASFFVQKLGHNSQIIGWGVFI